MAGETTIATGSAEETRALGAALGAVLAAGDLVMLSGGLGAGKTTLAQGIGEGMGVLGRVASPTFIIARVHPSGRGGPDLVHADAYRIRDLEDLETLDLDSSLDEAVTVVEWGEGKTEALSDSRLEVEVRRARGGHGARPGRRHRPGGSGRRAPRHRDAPVRAAVGRGPGSRRRGVPAGRAVRLRGRSRIDPCLNSPWTR